MKRYFKEKNEQVPRWSIKVKLPAPLGNHDRQIDQQTDRPTDQRTDMRAHLRLQTRLL